MPAARRGAPNFRPNLQGYSARAFDITVPNSIVAKGASARSQSGILNFYQTPRSNKPFIISGITKDSTGAVLGSCVVDIFSTKGGGYSSDDAFLGTATSDASTGAYSVTVASNGWRVYVVAYKAGSPDVAGTSVNTLLAT